MKESSNLILAAMLVFSVGIIGFAQRANYEARSEEMVLIDKITLAVNKIDETRNFYGAVFGVDFMPLELAGYQLYSGKLGKMELMLCPSELAGVNTDINSIQLRFVVDDVRAALAKGLASGGTLISDVAEVDGRLHASLRDPEWNSLELIQ